MSGHYFKFSTNWQDGKRLCRECGQKYDDGDHIEVSVLKPYTTYICPTGEVQGHSGRHSGAQDIPELRGPNDDLCICGARFVEEDSETWRLSWEMRQPGRPWHPVSKVATRHETHSQYEGLLELIARGEDIRKVDLKQLVERSS